MIVSPASAREPFNPPIQIWACGMPDHHHRAKGDAVKCLEKQARGAPADRFPPLPETRFASPPEGPQEADRAMKTEAAIDAAKRAIETAEGALAKAEGRKSDEAPDGSTRPSRGVEYADPGYQSDGKPRYPIDTERHIRAAWNYVNRPSNAQRYTSDQVARIRAAIIAAWKDKVDIDGPPSANEDEKASSAALAKALCEAGHVSEIILDLEWLQAALEDEAAIDGNISTQAPRVQALIAELRDLMTALVADETGEFLTSGQIADESLAQLASELITMTAGVPGAARIAALLDAGNPNMQKLASALLAKAKHSQGDQALADMALYACDSCLKIGGLSVAEKAHVTSARDNLRKAGAAPPVTATTDMAGIIAPQMDVPSCDVRSDDMATPDGSIGSGATALGKRAQMHQDLMDVAHDCITKLTGGMACSPRCPVPNRRQREMPAADRQKRPALAILPKR